MRRGLVLVDRVLFLVGSALICTAALAQQPTFGVATIRPSAESVPFERDGRTEFTPDMLRMQDVTISTCIRMAWHLQEGQVDGPELLTDQRYDITAKTDAPATKEQMKLMFRNLLQERFRLAFHHEQRELKVYLLAVAPSGPKLKAAANPDAVPFRENSANGTVVRSMPLSGFADFLSSPLERPVLDRTALSGKYDFAIDFTSYIPEPGKNMDASRPDAVSLLRAVMRDQLGLTLNSGKALVDVIVVDHVEKPAEN